MKIDKDFVIKTLTFCDYLEKEQQKLLLDNISCINYKKGDQLLSPMVECIGILMVKRLLKVYIISEDGQREITYINWKRRLLCLVSFLHTAKHTLSLYI